MKKKNHCEYAANERGQTSKEVHCAHVAPELGNGGASVETANVECFSSCQNV